MDKEVGGEEMKRGFYLFWVVQFLGASNDILFKTLVSFMGARIMGDVASSSGFVAIAGFFCVAVFGIVSGCGSAVG